MYEKEEINHNSNKYMSSLIGQIFDLDIDTEEVITGYIESFGIENFLKNFYMLDLPKDVMEKLESLKLILEAACIGEKYRILVRLGGVS